jgi:hypothetical protein
VSQKTIHRKKKMHNYNPKHTNKHIKSKINNNPKEREREKNKTPQTKGHVIITELF